MQRTKAEMPLAGRRSRFLLLAGGFALLLALNAFITWSMPTFFPTEGAWVSLGPLFGRICVIINFATFFLAALFGVLFPHVVRRILFPVAACTLIAGFILLDVAVLKERSSVAMLSVGACAIGVGSAGLLILWEKVFSENVALGIRRVLLVATAATVVPYYLIVSLVPREALVLALSCVLVPAALVTLWFALRGGDTPELVDETPRRNASGYARAFGTLWVPMLCSLAFGLVSPIVDIVALREATSYGLLMFLIQASSVFVAAVFWLVWERLHVYPSITRVCLIILPTLALLLFFFPFASRGYSYVVLFVAAACYVVISIFMMVTCIDVAEATRTSLVVLYGVFAGVLYLSRWLGEVIARAFVDNPYDQQVQVIASAVFLVYVMSMAAFLAYRAVSHGSASRGERGAGPVTGAAATGPSMATPEAGRRSWEATDAVAVPAAPSLSKKDIERALEARCANIARTYGLSERERDVLILLARGYTVPGVADELVLSENTVRTHTKRLYLALGIHTKQELIRLVDEADTV